MGEFPYRRPFGVQDLILEQQKLIQECKPVARASLLLLAEANKLLKGSGRMLVRKSGTEPVIRIMCESENHAILSKCVNIVKNSIN
mgnify:CR=1 FL=1